MSKYRKYFRVNKWQMKTSVEKSKAPKARNKALVKVKIKQKKGDQASL